MKKGFDKMPKPFVPGLRCSQLQINCILVKYVLVHHFEPLYLSGNNYVSNCIPSCLKAVPGFFYRQSVASIPQPI